MARVDFPCASIVHPGAFTEECSSAFAHALGLASHLKSNLTLLKVRKETDPSSSCQRELQQADAMLDKWRAVHIGSRHSLWSNQGPFDMQAVSISARNARSGVLTYLESHGHDLVVLANHTHKGFSRWLEVTTEQSVLRQSMLACLFIRDGAHGFIDHNTGAASLNTILLPIDSILTCEPALRRIESLALSLTLGVRIIVLHIGDDKFIPPDPGANAHDWPIVVQNGPVVATILRVAQELKVDLIAMPTAGRHGLRGAIRGSTTAQILDDGQWPLLSLPVG